MLHWLLVNTFPMHQGNHDAASDGAALLVVMLVFALAVAMEHLSNLRSDAGRQQLLRRGLSMMCTSALAHNAHSDIQQSLIADHLDGCCTPTTWPCISSPSSPPSAAGCSWRHCCA